MFFRESIQSARHKRPKFSFKMLVSLAGAKDCYLKCLNI
jgi:hypothetical protein